MYRDVARDEEIGGRNFFYQPLFLLIVMTIIVLITTIIILVTTDTLFKHVCSMQACMQRVPMY